MDMDVCMNVCMGMDMIMCMGECLYGYECVVCGCVWCIYWYVHKCIWICNYVCIDIYGYVYMSVYDCVWVIEVLVWCGCVVGVLCETYANQ